MKLERIGHCLIQFAMNFQRSSLGIVPEGAFLKCAACAVENRVVIADAIGAAAQLGACSSGASLRHVRSDMLGLHSQP